MGVGIPDSAPRVYLGLGLGQGGREDFVYLSKWYWLLSSCPSPRTHSTWLPFSEDLSSRRESGWGFVCLALRAGGGGELRWGELEGLQTSLCWE